jgi:ABC-type taurine transport system substrate-binding protein
MLNTELEKVRAGSEFENPNDMLGSHMAIPFRGNLGKN